MKIFKNGLSFDDVLLKPRRSTITSRFSNDIDLSVKLVEGIKLNYPIISANMDTVTGMKMANAMSDFGALGIIHRFISIEEHEKSLQQSKGFKVACIGLGSDGKKRAEKLNNVCSSFLIDVAHGHSDTVLKQIEWLKRFKKPIIAGNVATALGTEDLIEAGADSVKCGVGPGSVCSTRQQTGCGVPQLTAVMECANQAHQMGKTLIADGGIRYAGDIVKAIAAGADAVMIGSIFAGTEEAPGQVFNEGTSLKKMYRGMASKAAQMDWKGIATSIEGEMTNIVFKGSVKSIFNNLINGILSGMSYQDAHNLKELHDNAEFIIQTNAGIIESSPHGK